jgi:hypothetical protein
MGQITTLGTIIDAAAQGPATKQEIYRRGKYCRAEPCSSCSTQFERTWGIARRLGLIVRSGRKFMLRDWNEGVAEALGIWL